MPDYRLLHVNGVDIAVFEWGQARADQPSILFVHATGFHARIWDQVIAHLPELSLLRARPARSRTQQRRAAALSLEFLRRRRARCR